jgi:hypothetical protein
MPTVHTNSATTPDGYALVFEADASQCDANGVYDAAYDFGEEGTFRGAAEEVGRAVATYLSSLDREAVERLKQGTNRYYLQLVIEPICR